MVALIGGSGAGKTSLLETLIGLHAPTSGSVTVDGVDVAQDRRAIDVGLVPQDDIIHVDLPLRSTLRYAAKLRLPRTVSDAELDQIVDRVLADLELTERADVVVRNLSGGPAQACEHRGRAVDPAPRCWPSTSPPVASTPRPPARSWSCCDASRTPGRPCC
jgi:ABC-type multidrug transport system ATPase subunit